MSGATSPFCAAIERLASAKGRGRLGTRRLAEGQLMCAADDPDLEDDGLLVVRSGRLRCFTSFEGKELTLFTLDPNDVVFVEAGFMLEARRDCTFWVMSLSAFREAALDEPLLALSAVDVFERMLRKSVRMVEDMAFFDVRRRLIRALCETADRDGRSAEAGVVIDRLPNAEAFATEIGATRQTVSTVFAELMRAGLMERAGASSLVIADIGRLWEKLVVAR